MPGGAAHWWGGLALAKSVEIQLGDGRILVPSFD
jgi:hypothetical protein